jgi:hypothetical protein
MRIHIEQTVEPDGLPLKHPEYHAWKEGVITVWRVNTTAICLESGRKAQDDLGEITTPEDDESYLKEIKGEQIRSVLSELGFEME